MVRKVSLAARRPVAAAGSNPLLSGLSCRFWDFSCRRLLQSDTLMKQQPALPADPAAVSGKTPISADDSVARNHNGNWVCAVGQANRTDRFRAAQLTRQRSIT